MMMYVPLPDKTTEDSEAQDMNVSPVASHRSLQLIYRLGASSRVKVKLVNALGRIAREFDLGKLQEGTHTSQLDVSRMPAGIYSLQLIRGKAGNTTRQAIILY